ncbi:MAG: hypothetical protein RLZZ618_2142 [Pseudomonadota bacterium]|jgi:uncharacterized lipoprotein YmbA
MGSLGLAGLLAACSTAEAPRFHSLLPSLQTAAAPPAATSPPLYIDLGPVGIPASIDQPQWVVRMPDDSLRMLEQERWVGPLRDELRSAVAERLARHWGAVDVRTTPAPANTGWRVRIDVQRFESVIGREAWVESQWSAVSFKTPATTLTCRVVIHDPAVGDPAALAAAHRRAVVQLADAIGERLRAVEQGGVAACAKA